MAKEKQLNDPHDTPPWDEQSEIMPLIDGEDPFTVDENDPDVIADEDPFDTIADEEPPDGEGP